MRRAARTRRRSRFAEAEALANIPVGLTLAEAVTAGTTPALLGDLVAVLDGPEPVPGVRLTTLLKVLHRKRPVFIRSTTSSSGPVTWARATASRCAPCDGGRGATMHWPLQQ